MVNRTCALTQKSKNDAVGLHKGGLCCRRRAVSVKFVHYVETAKETAIVAMKCDQETVPKLSNGTIFTDLERLLTQTSSQSIIRET